MSQANIADPLFLGGFPSGGTDLLKNILNAHPQIHINGEMPFLYNLEKYGLRPDQTIKSSAEFDEYKEIFTNYDIWDNLEGLADLNFKDFDQKEITLKEFLRKAFNDNDRLVWGNKTPQNTENVDELLKFFPNAKFVIIIRDIRDTALSWKNKWGKNMLLTAHKWNQRLSNVSKSEQLLWITFEDMLEDLEATTKRICSFLEIEWSNQMLEHSKFVEKKIDGKINYGKAVISGNKEKWKEQLSAKQIRRIEEIAFNTLNKYNYAVEHAKSEVAISGTEKLFGKIHDLYATLFIGNLKAENNSFGHRLKSAIDQVKYRIGAKKKK